MQKINKQAIIILDFGSQYSQLIARRVRELGVYCEIYPYDVDKSELETITPCGLILSGGPSTVTEDTNPRAPQWVFDSGLPLLGICYGMQTMAAQLGGAVESSTLREFGYAELRLHGHSQLLANIEDRTTEKGEALLDVWMSHGDKVTVLPPGFEVICETRNAPIAGMADEARNWYGLQFHPEVTHTLQGLRILERFVVDICKAKTDWTADNIIEQSILAIREQVGNDEVLFILN